MLTTYKLFAFVGDAGFYFLPVIVGYTASRQFKTSPILSMLLGGILLEPSLVNIVSAGKSFSIFGIPMGLVSYGSTILPIILSVWVMSYIERFFKKYLPDSVSPLLTPTLTIFVMLPITLCGVGPLGSYLGDLINALVQGASHLGGVWSLLATGLIAGFWPILVMTGMHLVLLATALVNFATVGKDSFILVCGALAGFSSSGIAIGAALKLHSKEEKRMAWSYLFANIIGGATEPTLYGVAVRYKRPFISLIIGGFVGGIYAGLSHLTMWVMVQGAFILEPTAFIGGGSSINFINGLITGAITTIVAAAVTYFWGIPSAENRKLAPLTHLAPVVPIH
ncbi:PTS transporter subunit EIIC [Pediococcus siamensis]|uniref:PTS transporter subunit EIIC n=1 Tax=Pediococcus siamensis TaxID=381829 RepID=UPI0039A2E191